MARTRFPASSDVLWLVLGVCNVWLEFVKQTQWWFWQHLLKSYCCKYRGDKLRRIQTKGYSRNGQVYCWCEGSTASNKESTQSSSVDSELLWPIRQSYSFVTRKVRSQCLPSRPRSLWPVPRWAISSRTWFFLVCAEYSICILRQSHL